MNRRFLIWALALVTAGGLVEFIISRGPSVREPVAFRRDGPPQTDTLKAPASVRLSLKLRLAIGGLGFTNENQTTTIADLVVSELSNEPGLELVDRQSLDAAIQESELSLSGLVRAKDAVHTGKLLHADWFLLGTIAKINTTNILVVRLVDARTGITEDGAVFPSDQPAPSLAQNLGYFLHQARQAAASAKPRTYLAIGSFKDLSVNERQVAFPSELRAYLTAAYQKTGVIVLERDYAETLLHEMQLDLLGLTENSASPPPPMQFAFWLADGYYQSYETTNLQVELSLNVQRIFGTHKQIILRGIPGLAFSQKIKETLDASILRPGPVKAPTSMSEARAQIIKGRDFLQLNPGFSSVYLAFVSDYSYGDPIKMAKQKADLQEAIRAFESALLLDPGNREAKMSLAYCFRYPVINRMDEAREYYREIIEDPMQDDWSGRAQLALLNSFENYAGRTADPEEKARWFSAASTHGTNSTAASFFNSQAEAARDEASLARGEGPEIEQLAKKELLQKIRLIDASLTGKGGGSWPRMGMDDYVKHFGANRAANAARLAALLPELNSQFPELKPFFLPAVVCFQVNTNAGVVNEFENELEELCRHPKQVFASDQFWDQVQFEIYEWGYEHKAYPLAAKVTQGKLQAAAKGVVFTDNIINENCIELAYAYKAMGDWQHALEVFKQLPNTTITLLDHEPWDNDGAISIPREIAQCNLKLGRSEPLDPRQYQMENTAFGFTSPSPFAADEDGVWIPINGRLLRLGFDLKTNLNVPLPLSNSTFITCMAMSDSRIWIGTDGEGLLEYDRTTHKTRSFSEHDGLLMNSLASIAIAGNTLWIGYGRSVIGYMGAGFRQDGGLGMLDMATMHFTSFSPPITQQLGIRGYENTGNLEAGDTPTRRTVSALSPGPTGDIWFITEDTTGRLRRYQTQNNTWTDGLNSCFCLLSDQTRMFAGQYWNFDGSDQSGGVGVSILDFKTGQWRSLKRISELPSGAISALAPDPKYLWIGGRGFIALLDPDHEKALKFAYIQAEGVDSLQISGGYLWAKYAGYLHRVPLSKAEP